jgi:hypothetical protein
MKKGTGLLVFCAAFFLLSCGLEDIPILDPVPQSNVRQDMNNRATVQIPSYYSGSPLSRFEIYYRIYVSDVLQASTTTDTYSAINSALASHYSTFRSYIDSTTHLSIDMDSIFQGRGYKNLYIEGDRYASSVLTPSVQGSTLVFDFSSSKVPTMTIGSNEYTLWRSNGGGLFSPQPPDRLFFNREELYRESNINNTINADVENKSGITGGRYYTYAAMFITAVGVNPATFSNIYSTPALIHVFLLPDR